MGVVLNDRQSIGPGAVQNYSIDNGVRTNWYEPGPEAATPATDSYAKWGGVGNYNNLVTGFGQEFAANQGSSNTAVSNFGKSAGLSVTDLIRQKQTGQTGIDQGFIDANAAQYIGQKGINQMVGQGIQSGGVLLANKNAGDSSGAEGIARAYGILGDREMRNVNNQFEAENRRLSATQADFDNQMAFAATQLRTDAEIEASNITDQATKTITALQREMLGKDIPTTVAIQQEIERVKGLTQSQLVNIDKNLTTGLGGIKAMGMTQAQSAGRGNVDAGKPPVNQFQYSTTPEVGFQEGPSPASIPLFTYRGQNEDNLV